MEDDRCTLKPSTTAMMVVVVVDSKRELRDCRPVSQIKVVCNIPASRVCIPCTAACVECMQNSGNHSPRCSHLLRLPRPSPFRIIRQKKVTIQSLTLNQFLGKKATTLSVVGGERVIPFAASYKSPRTIESRTSVVLKFVIFFYIYNCPFVPYIFRYNFFNDAFMTRSTRFPRYAIHTVYYRNESKQV